MPIYTTYLAYLQKFDYNPLKIFPHSLRSTIIYYVMRNRGNNEVAPSGLLLEWINVQKIKYGRKWQSEGVKSCWSKYKEEYLDQLKRFDPAKEWMQKRAEESKAGHHVVLVCFEKSPEHCHRRLLAEAITERFGAEYKGELSQYQ